MALNPYTLYHLYEKGILDYVPTDLIDGGMVPPLAPASNPYLEMAQQGGLYQNHGTGYDSFQMSSPYNVNPISAQGYSQIGSQSVAGGLNTFNGYGIGSQSQAGIANTFGVNGMIGSQSPNGIANSFGFDGRIGAQSQAGVMNAFGFGGMQNSFGEGLNKTVGMVSSMPKFVLGLLAGTIGVVGVMHAFKRGKKPPKSVTQNTSFWAKLNPKNWFKKAK